MDGKPWMCDNDHVLGIVRRVRISQNGSKYWTDRLYLFRQAVSDARKGRVLCDVDGNVYRIQCSECGAVRDWKIGEAALEALLETVMIRPETADRGQRAEVRDGE